MVPSSKQVEIFNRILLERQRQEKLKAEGRFPYTAADDIPLLAKNGILGEEAGEVSTACLNYEGFSRDYEPNGLTEIHKELIQVAAVALAFLEGISDEFGQPLEEQVYAQRF